MCRGCAARLDHGVVPWRRRSLPDPAPDSTISRYLRVARLRRRALLLDFQPGRSSFATEAARLDRYLRQPDVGLALDPEWHVGADQIPGQVIGSVDAATVNRVSAALAAVTEREQLPQKLFVVHQFPVGMIADRSELVARPELATIVNSTASATRRARSPSTTTWLLRRGAA